MIVYQNDEERRDIVGLALMVADGASAAGPNTARILAHEVRTLRKELDGAKFVDAVLHEKLEQAQATIKRVEALRDDMLKADSDTATYLAGDRLRDRLRGGE